MCVDKNGNTLHTGDYIKSTITDDIHQIINHSTFLVMYKTEKGTMEYRPSSRYIKENEC